MLLRISSKHIYRFCYGWVFILAVSCFLGAINKSASNNNSLTLNLAWHKAYESQQWANVKTGLAWSFSLMGASMPGGRLDKSITFSNKYSTLLQINLYDLGFSHQAIKTFAVILDTIKSSPDYQRNNSIDIGRFLTLTLHSSWNYYAITQMPERLSDFKKEHKSTLEIKYMLNHSDVAIHERLITIYPDSNILDFYFIASEPSGNLNNDTEEFEVMNVMPNSQLRFGIYDKNGFLKAASDTSLSIAGKPGKCMWCHESKALDLFQPSDDIEGYLKRTNFIAYVESFNVLLNHYRSTLETDIVYTNLQDHTQSELLYVSFMQSSSMRIASETQMKQSKIKNLLKIYNAEEYHEFPFLGNLYSRSLIDSLFFSESLKVPTSVREPSLYEPDFTELSK